MVKCSATFEGHSYLLVWTDGAVQGAEWSHVLFVFGMKEFLNQAKKSHESLILLADF